MHTCHAHGCTRPVPPAKWGYRPHWLALPKNIRDAIWREYRYGQEDDKQPSLRYMAVQQLAVMHTAFKPNDEEAARVCAGYLFEAMQWQRQAIEAKQGDPLEGLLV